MPNNDNCINWAHVSIDLAKPDSEKTEIKFRDLMGNWSSTPRPKEQEGHHIDTIGTLHRLYKMRYVTQLPPVFNSRCIQHPIFEPAESNDLRFYTEAARRDGLTYEAQPVPAKAKPKRDPTINHLPKPAWCGFFIACQIMAPDTLRGIRLRIYSKYTKQIT